MADLIKLVSENQVIKDDDKKIEIVRQVEQKEYVSIRQLRQEIVNIDATIASLNSRKAEIQKKIDDCVSTLKLTVEGGK